MDLALNNLQRLICYKTQTNKLDKMIKYKMKENGFKPTVSTVSSGKYTPKPKPCYIV